MFSYQKRLQYPVNIKSKDLRMAKYLITQYGGPNGELSAAIRYLNQRFNMPDNRGATIEEIKEAGLEGNYTEHGLSLFPTDANGYVHTSTYFADTGDWLANLTEDMAAEQKARAVYENLIDLTTDQDVIEPLLFLRQREIVHFARFKELCDIYTKEGV